MTSCGWLWIYAGSALMLLELITPGFILCFFGLSAATVGALRFVFGEAFGPTWQLAAFSFFAVFYIVLLRRWLKNVFSGEKMTTKTDFDHESVGRVGTIVAAILPPLSGRVLIGDAEWDAASDVELEVGASVRVVSQDNLTMRVKRI